MEFNSIPLSSFFQLFEEERRNPEDNRCGDGQKHGQEGIPGELLRREHRHEDGDGRTGDEKAFDVGNTDHEQAAKKDHGREQGGSPLPVGDGKGPVADALVHAVVHDRAEGVKTHDAEGEVVCLEWKGQGVVHEAESKGEGGHEADDTGGDHIQRRSNLQAPGGR